MHESSMLVHVSIINCDMHFSHMYMYQLTFIFLAKSHNNNNVKVNYGRTKCNFHKQ